MPVTESIGRRQCIPILYTRGTHYEVGFDVGRTFSGIIKNFVQNCSALNEEFLVAYETPQGRKAYEDTLNAVKTSFPQYIQELEGTADGAQVPFYKLFLLHMDNVVLSGTEDIQVKKLPTGCSSICVNQKEGEFLGHTEDALSDTLNHYYFVSAHIVNDKPQGKWKVKEEKFTSLCYAGHLPGYTMNYNHHGLIFSINTLSAKDLKPGKIPRHFLTRALLSAKNFKEAQEILRDCGMGAADGCSVNMTFLNQEGDRMFHNAEIAPGNGDETELNILSASPGENLIHCNQYLRMKVEESNDLMVDSSVARLEVLSKYNPKTKKDIEQMLGDQSNSNLPVFRGEQDDYVKTICVGIFDLKQRTWSLYSDNPNKTEPLVVLPLVIKQ